MKKLIICLLAMSVGGCSSIWANMPVDHCNYIPPIADTVGVAGLGGVIVVLSEGDNIHLSESNKRDFAIASGIVAAVFTISAYIGYLKAYHTCKEQPDG